MSHNQTVLCGNIIGIDKLERLKFMQSDSLIREFSISVREPETVSPFLGNLSYKTTQKLREVNFRLFRRLLIRSKHNAITIDIDSSGVNVEGHQGGTAKRYNPKKPGKSCYNLQFAICDETKAFLTGYTRSGDTVRQNECGLGPYHQLVRNWVSLAPMGAIWYDPSNFRTRETYGCR
jgi:hypothetical protein